MEHIITDIQKVELNILKSGNAHFSLPSKRGFVAPI